MKKTLLLSLMLLFATATFAQTRASFVSESFDSKDFPEGWSIQGLGTSGSWSISSSNNAGGSPNELMLYYNPAFNGVSRIVMNTVDLTNVESVVVQFKHYLDNYSGSHLIGIATSSDGGTTWNTGWSQNYELTGTNVVNQVITTPDMGKANVQFCMFYEGNSYNVNSWCFDDFEIFVQEEFDLKVVSIDIPEIIPAGETDIVFTVQNIGKSIVNYFEAEIYCNDWCTPITVIVDQTLSPFEKKQINLSNYSPEQLIAEYSYGYYNVSVNILNVDGNDDDDINNNFMEKNVFAAWGKTQRTTMIEHFSSSTCGPCVSVNNTMNAVTSNNPGKYTYTKYQMNWPSPGDLYYTPECATRLSFYACDALPSVFFNGKLISPSEAQNLLDIDSNVPAYTNIRGAFDVEGNTINIIADFMSYVKLENVAAFISINEKETTGNVGSNGETSFHHVFMKMLEDANGNIINLEPGKYHRFELSFDMSSTNVEDMDDLEVALWLQNMNTHEVYNSKFAYEYSDHYYPIQNLRETTASKGKRTFSWDVPEQGTPTGYKVYVDGMLAEVNTQNTYVETESSKSLLLVEVIALYEGGKTSVAVIDKFGSGTDVMENKETSNFGVYPNPTSDYVRLSNIGEQQSVLKVYNVMGMMVDEIEIDSNNMQINISDYKSGIYFFNINGEVVKVIKK